MSKAFPLIDLDGDAESRGLQYGRQARDRIARGLELYRQEFRRCGMQWSSALSKAEAYLPALERFDAEMYAEILAIARGADFPVASIAILNARTELGLAARQSEECTAALALADATADGSVLHGQNWDWRPGCVETSVVLRITLPEGGRILTFCEAGQLARHGMNDAGIALTANGLQVPGDPLDGGVPTPILRRRMLMMRSLAAAAAVAMNAKHSSSHALMLSHVEGEAYCIEMTPKQFFWLLPEAGIMTHANHFKAPGARLSVEDISLRRCPESLYRDSRSQAALMREQGNISIDTFKGLFADRYGWPDSICRPPAARADGAMSATVASLIMNTSEGKLWLAPAPYEGAEYREYAFS